ncbi:FAD-dependent monooxygenase [Paenibacillus sedimenti]|uniref:FAD-dependent monooxygenase n=1 Tax=Paenibacillus sedimenti TaxID=2770274 RepID=A0A926KW89_9BACL|nr:FAD-dependent monooxygenase [Paenibacillus sedimenti]MBD0383075.1 FAD-dependent monooxygenase [Paenibacillus sedimenti]
MRENKALIIGAGIGGLCIANFLQLQGWEVTLFEKKSALSEYGAGIVLAANAMEVLERLGIAEQVRDAGAKVGVAEIRTWNGHLIAALPTHKLAARYGTYSYLIHRAALQSILYRGLTEHATLKLNMKLTGIEQKEGGVTARFEDGNKETGDILIGADGIYSAVRDKLFGHAELRYSGFTAYRGVTSFQDKRYVLEKGGGFEAWGRGKRFGYSHLGQDRIFWFAAINAPANQRIPQEQLKEEVLRHFHGWFDPIEAVVQATDADAILSHDIFDREPLERWSQGSITLLGDAAHPMLPILGQGGAQAMEDALVLAQCLQGDVDVTRGLRNYEQIRIPRTCRVVRQSRKMGRMVQLDNPLAIGIRNQILRLMPEQIQMNQLHWLLGTNN